MPCTAPPYVARPSTEPQLVSGVLRPSRPPRPPPAIELTPPVAIEKTATTTLSPTSALVAAPERPATEPPKAVRTGRWLRRPCATHSGHWCPTEAAVMQSGQIGRLQRVHRTYVSRDGWR